MSDVQEDVNAQGEISGQGEPKAISKEEIDGLIAERLEQNNKQWQSRFDKLRTEKSQLEQEAEEKDKTWQQRMEDTLSSVKGEVEEWKSQAQMEGLKSQAIKRVSSAGLEFDDVEEKLVYKLIDPSSDDPLSDVDEYIEREKAKAEKIKMSAADEFTKKHGRKVDDGNPNYKTIDDYTADEIKRMPEEEFEKIMARSK